MSLYSEIFYSKEVNSLFSNHNHISKMLLVEAALAKAQAEEGIIPKEAATIIEQCCNVNYIDLEQLKNDVHLGGNAAIPLVKQLVRIVKNNDFEASKYVHFGATSQDIIDTATVLLIQEYLHWVQGKTHQLKSILLELTKSHRETLMMGRTLLQQAKPITFGLKTAGWLEALHRTDNRLEEAKMRVLSIQLGGAVGSGNKRITAEVKQTFANLLGLSDAFTWQAHRDNFSEWASVLSILSGTLGKIAKDISLLMQTEIGEVYEPAAPGRGGSSTMPHKRNPVICAVILANAMRTPNLTATMHSSMIQEHERSAGLWHAEWEVLTQLMALTAGTVEKSIELLSGLEVHPERMLHNLELTNGLIYAENVSLALAQKMGKIQAHELVEKACEIAIRDQKHLKQVLLDQSVDLADLDSYFDPKNSIGQSISFVDSIIATYENQL
ncbi:3-carboxy-cis,cis-muconate cycloisomerase [Allomuricauda sp. NBRC 101325]|uniref:3-carboxy-cis,cis-muconate cycloisomerase n=1 Tax=Allomuricauda sp. NBRC 101325 TaxID=1113758 RepID=UPI0024A334EC|nr:3-carboxy-cis,cis-muconate cycloisomerase [Muricauda sp. NBRC 101325]GLU43942.1 3-carboxy-cis,cis-muconate cycloisomerase [Muricauda sp. NBRC 101325]